MEHGKPNDKQDEEIRIDPGDLEFAAFHEIIEENQDIAEDELVSHRRAFKHGYRRSLKKLETSLAPAAERPRRLTLLQGRTPRRIFAAAAAAVVVISVVAVIYSLTTKPGDLGLLTDQEQIYAVSGMFGDLQSEIPSLRRIRSSTNRGLPVPGVTIHHRNSAGQFSSRFLTTNAYAQTGLPRQLPASGDLVFKVNGVEVGALDITQLSDDQRLLPFELDPAGNLITAENTIDYAIDLEPGEQIRLNDRMLLELDATAGESWQGKVIHDFNWPGLFKYGNVIEGILRFEGQDSSHLILTVAVPTAKLEHYTDQPGRLQVYAEKLAAPPRINFFESSWYQVDSPPAASSTEPRPVEVAALTGGYAVTWQADTTEQYSILAPPADDGALIICNMYNESTTGQEGSRHVFVNGFTRPQNDRWDAYYASATIPSAKLTVQPQSPNVSVNLDSPNHLDDHPEITILGKGVAKDNGTITARRYDFTLSGFTEYGPLQLECPKPQGNYEVVADLDRGTVELTGDTGLLAGIPQWDLDADYVVDGSGLSTEFEVLPLQVREIAVVFQEQDGAWLRIKSSVSHRAAGTYGFRGSCPLIPGIDDPPVKKRHVLAMTPNTMLPPYPPGTLASNQLIPFIVVTPSAALLNKPLAGLTLTINGSPAGGETDRVYFDPFVFPARLTGAPGQQVVKILPDFFGAEAPRGIYSFNNASIDALKYLEYRGTGVDIGAVLHSLVEGMEPDITRWGMYRKAYGLDLDNLPGNDEIYQKLESFRDGDFFTYEFLTEHDQQLVFNVDLWQRPLAEGEVIIIGLCLETRGWPVIGQWDMYSGGSDPAKVVIQPVKGVAETYYLDFTPFVED